MVGLGLLAGYSRTVGMPGSGVMDAAPYSGIFVQSVTMQLAQLQAQIVGDPDFDLLRVFGGTSFGFTGPGRTTLTKLPGGDWSVDSFFDITYRVDFVGRAGGPLGGYSGSTNTGARIREGLPKDATCVVSTPPLPSFPPPCPRGWASPPDAHVCLNGLPPGVPITGTIAIIPGSMLGTVAGGPFGGVIVDFDATAIIDMAQQGGSGYQRFLAIPLTCRAALSTGSDSSPMELIALQGQIVGDPDFDLLRITAGSSFGYSGPGHITSTTTASGNQLIDSFFDIEYRIDFIGAPGGPFAGSSGSTNSANRFRMGQQEQALLCDVADVLGTAKLPANCPNGYVTPKEAVVALNGLPPGEPILGQLSFFNILHILESAGGSLGGSVQTFSARHRFDMHGTGTLAGWSRVIDVPVSGKAERAAYVPGATPQSAPTDMVELTGQITGDPDFDLLRIAAGTAFGSPSPGHTTLTAGSDWSVDSFFDIEYRIDFIGAPGGPLAGMSGSTTSTERYRAGDFGKVAVDPSGGLPLSLGPATPNPSNERTTLSLALSERSRVRAAVYDVSGRQLAMLSDEELAAGQHTLAWNGLDSAGRRAPAGLYFVRVIVGGREIARRVALRF
jgi:hypothetical protein